MVDLGPSCSTADAEATIPLPDLILASAGQVTGHVVIADGTQWISFPHGESGPQRRFVPVDEKGDVSGDETAEAE